ncbi:MAG: citramalate synthase [Nitrospinaceae bacterium]|nr:citramalate synthase [Nitrospinaceae bacterium]NIR57332.1 citramalate synthase [Nitrospinaceae bacterium]NIS87784.1 citramalate synthase [Nitrospinaceae bacterium]NIT84654.1 citramalate synthase [Nitrospinaceae bacterium]NIU46833.1 citramalate synthase [Nitrospinaceae bacterium]
MSTIKIYDTTLRDGSQAEEIAFTVEDKLRIAHKLDDDGLHYIEGGWPGSNPKDVEFFEKVKSETFQQAKLVAFGSTRSAKNKAENDPNLKRLLEAETPAVTIFGKTWDMHVKEALSTTLDENLRMVSDSLAFLKKHVPEVMFDAEHFFDGYKKNPEYALRVLKAAESGGADWLVLCDTNGGTMPWEIQAIMEEVRKTCKTPMGIHTHNDSELGVANALTAVTAGARQVQGTVNGYGERCGNCNLVSVIPNLRLKMGEDCVTDAQLKGLKELSAFVDELANKAHWNHQPFVGKSAFAHKGGVHVSAMQKNRETYEHIDPSRVGNQTRILVSDLSGKSNIVEKAREFGLDVDSKDPKIQELLDQLKQAENLGFQYEGAEASFELLMRDALGGREQHFEFIGFRVIVEKRQEDEAPIAEATVKIRVDGVQEVTAAEGHGPVNALDKAIRKALTKFYPELEELSLFDYKVRILDEKKGTTAKIRVLVESGDHDSKWGTVGVSEDIIEASWQALIDSIIYKLSAVSKSNITQD